MRKFGTIRESNQASGVRKAHYALYYVRKSAILFAGTGVRQINSVACGFSLSKSFFSDYPKSLISRINEVYVFFNIAIFYWKNINFIYNCLFCCNHTCYCIGMVSVTSASSYVTSASRYQSRSSMYIRGLFPRNSTELAEVVPIKSSSTSTTLRRRPSMALCRRASNALASLRIGIASSELSLLSNGISTTVQCTGFIGFVKGISWVVRMYVEIIHEL